MDFSQADPFDRYWSMKLRWLLQGLERREMNALAELRHQLACAMVIRAKQDERSNGYRETAIRIQNRIASRRLPWITDDLYRQDQTKKLFDLWVDYFGDPDDPDTQRKITETVQAVDRLLEEG